jgi:hypothetical protein
MGAHRDRTDQEILKNENLKIGPLKQSLTPLQLHYLSLLRRLVALKNNYQSDPKFEAWLMKAINKAIYSALRDCIEENIGEVAKELLRPEHQVN